MAISVFLQLIFAVFSLLLIIILHWAFSYTIYGFEWALSRLWVGVSFFLTRPKITIQIIQKKALIAFYFS